jgi:hypothetical protein
MSWMGFEPTIPAFEQAKTVHALDRAATVTGFLYYSPLRYFQFYEYDCEIRADTCTEANVGKLRILKLRVFLLPIPSSLLRTSAAASDDVTRGQFLFIDYLILASSFPSTPPPSYPRAAFNSRPALHLSLSHTTLSLKFLKAKVKQLQFQRYSLLCRATPSSISERGARNGAWRLYFISTLSLKRDRVILMLGCTFLAINVASYLSVPASYDPRYKNCHYWIECLIF